MEVVLYQGVEVAMGAGVGSESGTANGIGTTTTEGGGGG